MAYQMFAAIDVGSNDISMKIFEVTAKWGSKEVDCVSHILELGSDTYRLGYVSNEKINELCNCLNKFKDKMKEYGCKEYRAYATSAIREASNSLMIIELIELRTGIQVKILSNSEHRFMMLKGCASTMEEFDEITGRNTALLDMGAGSIQISLFEKQLLTATQNIKIGSIRVRDMMSGIESRVTNGEEVIEEYVQNELGTFNTMYLGDKKIKNVIAIGDEIQALQKLAPELKIQKLMTKDQIDYLYNKILNVSPQDMASKYGIPFERATLIRPAIIVYRILVETTKADEIFLHDITLCDGIVADYMDTERKYTVGRKYEQDIIASATAMAKRYKSNRPHVSYVSEVALAIFDAMKKQHGMNRRQRLQLEIACILHDCGKFINMQNVANNSYNIIMSTEMVGLSHKEREEIANAVRYNTLYLPAYQQVKDSLGDASYTTVAKLAAILRVANALDRSHKQKVEKFSMQIKDKKLVISVDTVHNITLEAALFKEKADFFEQIYGIRPVLKQRRNV
ncbi:MAG: HD domain-containing protein [Lachnospiraceae bacterium]|nr:HD domain-containing protein [Lachnospiraceae bacterium]